MTLLTMRPRERRGGRRGRDPGFGASDWMSNRRIKKGELVHGSSPYSKGLSEIVALANQRDLVACEVSGAP
jgi:hypothetical protein